ncbi:hypothetical protein [Streptomyces durhamensis]|uniref:hypothetical protein n=1 Tax=Streptomyces durhamensis TaxID=68194 RepID=UPI00068F4A37|nr:hypothetical protein [Streptomyces durhamensis]
MIANLSNLERAVALYASDMPLRFLMRPGNETTVLAWILQGVARLGLAEVRRSAAYAYGYRLLWLADLTTQEQDQAHQRRFPNERRWDRAERLASSFTVWADYPMTQAAKDRAGRPEVEGACRCGGAGWIGECLDPDDPTTRTARSCPGHNPEGRITRRPEAVTA